MPDNNQTFPGVPEHIPGGGSYVPKPIGNPVPNSASDVHGMDAAANLIRQKLANIFAGEPDARTEAREAETARPRSKHQAFMHQLSNSGLDVAGIQTAWHNYYVALPDIEKHEVWQEFYAASETVRHRLPSPHEQAGLPARVAPIRRLRPARLHPLRPKHASYTEDTIQPTGTAGETAGTIKKRLVTKVTANGKLRARHHLQSLAFGLSLGFVTLVIFLFGFFNEVIIAPFIQPGRTVGATPIIVDPNAVTASKTPEIIIPKINLEIPVDFSQTSPDEATIENALNNGIVHYPTTVLPGQTGNTAFFGHSSNNIFNPGKYKFAFVLLHTLQPGDTFYITYKGTAYVYKVFSTRIVEPTEVSVLDNVSGHKATATLITCDPPGTSLHRLVVVGDQISPDPNGNHKGNNTTDTATSNSTELPGNGPSLPQRIWDSIF